MWLHLLLLPEMHTEHRKGGELPGTHSMLWQQLLAGGSQEPLLLVFLQHWSSILKLEKTKKKMMVTICNISCLLDTAMCQAEGFLSVLFLLILKQPIMYIELFLPTL